MSSQADAIPKFLALRDPPTHVFVECRSSVHTIDPKVSGQSYLILSAEAHALHAKDSSALDDLIDQVVLKALREEQLVTQSHLTSLLPIKTSSDHNCLCHGISIALWGAQDKDYALRQAIASNMEGNSAASNYFKEQWMCTILERDHLTFGLEIERSNEEWVREWQQELELVKDTSRSLTEIHIFVLAHIIRRPIIVYSPGFCKDVHGEALAPIYFGGVYLPVLLPSDECQHCPVLLAYIQSHCTALIPWATPTESQVAAPLTNGKGDYLPIQFVDSTLFAPGGTSWRELLQKYMPIHETHGLPVVAIQPPIENYCTFEQELLSPVHLSAIKEEDPFSESFESIGAVEEDPSSETSSPSLDNDSFSRLKSTSFAGHRSLTPPPLAHFSPKLVRALTNMDSSGRLTPSRDSPQCRSSTPKTIKVNRPACTAATRSNSRPLPLALSPKQLSSVCNTPPYRNSPQSEPRSRSKPLVIDAPFVPSSPSRLRPTSGSPHRHQMGITRPTSGPQFGSHPSSPPAAQSETVRLAATERMPGSPMRQRSPPRIAVEPSPSPPMASSPSKQSHPSGESVLAVSKPQEHHAISPKAARCASPAFSRVMSAFPSNQRSTPLSSPIRPRSSPSLPNSRNASPNPSPMRQRINPAYEPPMQGLDPVGFRAV